MTAAPDEPVSGLSDESPVSIPRPHAVYGVGEDPDPRFSLANERTALAWIRTGLSLTAGGIALTSVVVLAGLDKVLNIVAMLACAAGAVFAVSALVTWARAERAMRLRQPLPPPRALLVLSIIVVLIAAVLIAFIANT